MRNLRNRTAAITGAGSGIGRALALRLAREGAHLALCDIDSAGLAETAAMLDGATVRTTLSVVDVARRDQVEQWADETVASHGSVNLIVNNAGVAQSGSVAATDYAAYERVLGINLWGVIHGTKAFLPYLQQAGEGHIVNVSSVFGLQAQPAVSAYNASKFAVRGFTEALRQELDMLDIGVSATCVHPGGIRTEIVRTATVAGDLDELFGNAGGAIGLFDSLLVTSADRAATVILDGVRRDARRVLIGADARLLDLEQRLLPTAYQRLNTTLVGAVGAVLSRLPTGLLPLAPPPRSFAAEIEPGRAQR